MEAKSQHLFLAENVAMFLKKFPTCKGVGWGGGGGGGGGKGGCLRAEVHGMESGNLEECSASRYM